MCSASASRFTAPSGRPAATAPTRRGSRVARQAYVANDRADAEAALQKQAAWNKRTVAVSRAPDGNTGSHILSYAATPQGTEAHALYGTPDEIGRTLQALRAAGAEYVILTLLGGQEQLRRFARDVMPAFSGTSAPRSP